MYLQKKVASEPRTSLIAHSNVQQILFISYSNCGLYILMYVLYKNGQSNLQGFRATGLTMLLHHRQCNQLLSLNKHIIFRQKRFFLIKSVLFILYSVFVISDKPLSPEFSKCCTKNYEFHFIMNNKQ
jgi:hypothetical protein